MDHPILDPHRHPVQIDHPTTPGVGTSRAGRHHVRTETGQLDDDLNEPQRTYGKSVVNV